MAGDFYPQGHTNYQLGIWASSYWCNTCQASFTTQHTHPDPITNPLANLMNPGIFGQSDNGWICPRCKSSNSPSTWSCGCNDYNTGTMYKHPEVEEDMNNLIEGLHFDIAAEEIEAHLQQRFSYHINRADEYKAQVEAFESVPEQVVAMSGGSPREQGKKAVEKHIAIAEKFKFMSEHLVDGATYRLTDRDLLDIEMLSEQRYF